jgi:hypothetical protein
MSIDRRLRVSIEREMPPGSSALFEDMDDGDSRNPLYTDGERSSRVLWYTLLGLAVG